MTDIIQELRSLIAKATPGPWVDQAGSTSGRAIVSPEAPKVRRNVAAIGGDRRDANAALIVAAINHLPALLDRLEAAERGKDAFPDHSQRLAVRMGGRLVPRDDIGAIIDRSRAKYKKAACDDDLGRKERTRCSHYVQVLDEVSAAIREVKP